MFAGPGTHFGFHTGIERRPTANEHGVENRCFIKSIQAIRSGATEHACHASVPKACITIFSILKFGFLNRTECCLFENRETMQRLIKTEKKGREETKDVRLAFKYVLARTIILMRRCFVRSPDQSCFRKGRCRLQKKLDLCSGFLVECGEVK